MRTAFTFALAATAFWALTCGADAQSLSAPIVTTHTLSAGKLHFDYKAQVSTYTPDAKIPAATLSAIAYERTDRSVSRPVIFVFNGGPGASSSPLHMSAFGPKIRLKGKDGVETLNDNPDTLLDQADLVFIDPPGTGLNGAAPDTLGDALGVDHDARAVLGLIKAWLAASDQPDAPVYICGESYGGFRLAVLAGMLSKGDDLPNLKGLILISPALDMARHGDMQTLIEFPSLAVAAWYHAKAPGKDAGHVFEAAQDFAIHTYAPALLQGPALPGPQRLDLARQIATFTGLSQAQVLDSDLRIDSEMFLAQLNADRGLDTGRLDMRVTATKARPINKDRPAGANDPALGLGRSNVIPSPLIATYLHHDLGVPGDAPYIALSLDLNFKWNWADVGDDKRFTLDAAPDIASLMTARKQVRLMLVDGYYDLAVPAWGARYDIEHSGAPLDRVTFALFPTGHSVFNPTDALREHEAPLRAFVSAGAQQP